MIASEVLVGKRHRARIVLELDLGLAMEVLHDGGPGARGGVGEQTDAARAKSNAPLASVTGAVLCLAVVWFGADKAECSRGDGDLFDSVVRLAFPGLPSGRALSCNRNSDAGHVISA